jgi:uncharacterized protein
MTTGETDLQKLLKTLNPTLNPGQFVFCSLPDIGSISPSEIVMAFQEKEGITVIIPQSAADRLILPYTFVAAWITLTVHSSLHAVGLTAAFANALAKQGISCNVVAAYHHDHIFVDVKDALPAMNVLHELAQTHRQE